MESSARSFQGMSMINCFFVFIVLSFQNLLVGPDSFSLGELAHAILIMTHYHALSSFALGCGVNIDSPQGHYYGDLSLLPG